jgi:hypothetical protein
MIYLLAIPVFVYWEAWAALAAVLIANFFYKRWRNRGK